MTQQLSVADVLERAADLIEPEGAWTQGTFARNAVGKPTGASSVRGAAVCWCLVGATEYAAGEDLPLSCRADKAVKAAIPGCTSVSRWNDAPERTQAEVVAKLREAAALAREQGK